MKTVSKLKYVLTFCFALPVCVAFGHDVPVHRAITANAAASALAESPAYASFINVISSDLSYTGQNGAINSMINGSDVEDNKVPPTSGDGGGYRSLNHFYDPLDRTYGKGLSDSPGFSGLLPTGDKRESVGTNSFAWGSISNCAGINFSGVTVLGIGINVNTSNRWSWPNARYYEWCGLTASNKVDRNAALANMFRAVGQVMHLLEDTSQPQHVRNEQHVDPFAPNSWAEQHDPWSSPIEVYGYKHVNQLYYGDSSMLDWHGAGFTKLEDFWDRHLYNGSSAALDAAENGGAQLGLAEWCNGNFLGDRHKYAEYFSEYNFNRTPNIMWYPYPSLFTSTPYLQHGAYVDTVPLKNKKVVNRYYLPKTSNGIQVNHFSTISYFGAKFPNKIFQVTTSIKDDNVLSDYHDAFIPKAVKYSAGLLDYFFRGTMDVSVIGYDTNTLRYTNLIVNTSGQDFSGGTFSIYQDDTNGIRTLIAQTNFLNQTLPDGDSMTMTFPSSTPQSTNLFLVYQGTIGVDSSGNALDPVDTNICIAVEKFMPWIEQTITYNHYATLESFGLQPGATITTNLESYDFEFTPTHGNFEVIINGGNLDDIGSIGGIDAPMHGMTPCGIPGNPSTFYPGTVIPESAVTIIRNRLAVKIVVIDNCAGWIGWSNVSITWRVWPAP